MSSIPVPFDTLARNYPPRPLKPGSNAQQVMAGLAGTPCCVQVSEALNQSGQFVPEHCPHPRRPYNAKLKIGGIDYYYILAVDELEDWFNYRYGFGETVSLDETE